MDQSPTALGASTDGDTASTFHICTISMTEYSITRTVFIVY